MLSKKRLLELVYSYIVYDGTVKKIARSQQYFAVRAALARIKEGANGRKRPGGVIWHTTGSGKTLTMLMIGKALALEPDVEGPHIFLVTDRVDLDRQVIDTFLACGKTIIQAQSGAHLARLISEKKTDLIATVIDKFETVSDAGVSEEDSNIFVLVDEAHRSQYGQGYAKMEAVLPMACYIAFTGTPLTGDEKNTMARFGDFIHKYTMNQAVIDGAVVPLLYEPRVVELKVDQAKIDRDFARELKDKALTKEEKASLKKKAAAARGVYMAEDRMKEIAGDIKDHFRANYQGTGFKAMLACSNKEMAVRYRKLLSDGGEVLAEVIISPPDTRLGHEDIDEDNLESVQEFWKEMMDKYHGDTKAYEKTIVDSFKDEGGVEILIVVDKLLTGFDAPRNSVIYIDKLLSGHNILQAIARVNRVFHDKEYGLVIDYRGIFRELTGAIKHYAELEGEGYDKNDVEGMLVNVRTEVAKLAERRTNVWEVLKEVSNKSDTEAMARHLEPKDKRDQFYKKLREFSQTMMLALSSHEFIKGTERKLTESYKVDLAFFESLRVDVKQRYGESFDTTPYEKKLRKLIDSHVGAEAVKIPFPRASLFDAATFQRQLNAMTSDAARADMIASRMKQAISVSMSEDPALNAALSTMIDDTIKAFREARLSDEKYYRSMLELLEKQRAGTVGESALPEEVRGNKEAAAYFGIIKKGLLNGRSEAADLKADRMMAVAAVELAKIIKERQTRDWIMFPDAQKAVESAIDECLFKHFGDEYGDKIEEAIAAILETAKSRYQKNSTGGLN